MGDRTRVKNELVKSLPILKMWKTECEENNSAYSLTGVLRRSPLFLNAYHKKRWNTTTTVVRAVCLTDWLLPHSRGHCSFSSCLLKPTYFRTKLLFQSWHRTGFRPGRSCLKWATRFFQRKILFLENRLPGIARFAFPTTFAKLEAYHSIYYYYSRSPSRFALSCWKA